MHAKVSTTSAEAATASASPLRFVTAASLFDGHDAAINIMRRIIQQLGAEVIHLGHNRSVEDVVTAALQEDAHAIALSSYQGGHVEYFKYMVDMLKERGGDNIKVFGGGGGVIVPEEIKELHDYGVGRIYSPQDGQKLGLEGMIKDMVQRATHTLEGKPEDLLNKTQVGDRRALARLITLIEAGKLSPAMVEKVQKAGAARHAPVLGITGTGGAGKSSVSDELIRRFRLDQNDQLKIAIIAVDPSRRKSGGALLGDRIRMNAINHPNIYFRSLATREGGMEVSPALPGAIAACKAAGFDLIFAETAGIGQGDAAVVEHADVSLYVMTPEFGAASKLEKIDMLDFADIVAVNKFDRRGAEDAVRDVSKQVQRNKGAWGKKPDEMPVFGTIAARFNDDGVTALYFGLRELLSAKGLKLSDGTLKQPAAKHSTHARQIVPGARARYLAEIADTSRGYRQRAEHQAQLARERQHLREVIRLMEHGTHPVEDLKQEMHKRLDHLTADSKKLLHDWPATRESYSGDEFVYKVRDKEFRTPLNRTSLSGTKIPRVALPRFSDEGDLLQWLLLENLPGYFPYTAGVFPFKRDNEDPTRMFAGEGGPKRTNARFHLVSKGMDAKRLSTAFDSVTLYGEDPAVRPDIYGKVGNSGVSIATLDDMKDLYAGFDLCSPTTSVSMTINGPAPTILALFLNTAIDQQIEKFTAGKKRAPNEVELAEIKKTTLATVRGTVQADILKEDQGQNTCIFSTEFSLKCMGDIQQFFIENNVRNFYSVSISGYHIAEAGANPISQLAFTLANGFTYVESYLARGMKIDDFAPNLSFFFSNGMDPEYSVMGRVARRIWAVAMKEKYGANARSQMLKYHIQTSGRSLHAQEIDFNDIRTTLQALIAIYDNCNSLHTNAFDEAITTPTADSVRRALAIQLIINNEWGVAKNENPNQGAFLFDELTDLVEEAVLKEFERISERGGVLGAMETGYQRGRIQEESMVYEHKKHDGSLPIIGVNTFLNPTGDTHEATTIELARSSDDEKQDQLNRLAAFHDRNKNKAPAALAQLKDACIHNGNIFAALMNAARVCSLGQITHALFEVGGQYRRNM
ncbi:MAG TPA: fused isobutyryl-CoA mutase/GTPase IcmF [Stenotrophobium sp.]|nr:fused isobutyryl-CoA mutase/GTPase IcmF [Stenotrophobium sp.]